MVLTSPNLSTELATWLAAGPRARPDEALEVSLAEGRWGPAGLHPVLCNAAWTRCGAVEPAVRIALRLRRELASWPEVRSQVRLRVNPSVTQAGVLLRFLTRRSSDETGVMVYST